MQVRAETLPRAESLRKGALAYALRTKKVRIQDGEDFASYCVERHLETGEALYFETAWVDWQREVYGRTDRYASARAKRIAMTDWKPLIRLSKDEPAPPLPIDPLDGALKGQAAFLEILREFKLKGEDHGILVLVYLFDMTPAEVAFVMGRTKGTIDQRLHHLRRAMRIVELEP